MKCNICKQEKEEEDFYHDKKQNIPIQHCKECIGNIVNTDIIKAIPYLDAFNAPILLNRWKNYSERNTKLTFGKYLSFTKLLSIRELGFFNSFEDWSNEGCSFNEIIYVKQKVIEYIANKINN